MSDTPFEGKVVAQGVVDGIPWVAMRAPLYGALNGYIRVPDGHVWLEYDPSEIRNCVPWGEFTYGSGNWLGFDTLHSGQWWPGEVEYWPRGPRPGDQIMTDEMVIGWCRDLAAEAAGIINGGSYVI